MADLRLRTIVGLILVAVALIADWLGGWPFAVAIAATATVLRRRGQRRGRDQGGEQICGHPGHGR